MCSIKDTFDMKQPRPHTDTFSARVVARARAIPPGRVTTYGRIARAAGGSPILAQSITTILSKATAQGVTDIPYHRIVYADGHIWVNAEHRAERLTRYAEEGIDLDERDRIVNFSDVVFEFE